MKERETFPGKTYAVTSPNGCTVTTEAGITLAEIEAGKQGYFVAVGGKVLLSDDAAILTQLFKLAPQQRLALLGVLGGGTGLPAGYKQVEYLESTGTQYIDTLYNPCWDSEIKLDAHFIQNVASTIFSAVERKNESDGEGWKNSYFVTAYVDDTGWLVFGNSIPGFAVAIMPAHTRNIYSLNKKEITVNGQSVGFVPVQPLDYRCPVSAYLYARHYALSDSPELLTAGRIYDLKISENGQPKVHLIPCLDTTGAPCMFDMVRRKTFYNKGSDDFIYPTESTTYALRRVLPDWGKLTENGLRRLYHAPANWQGELYDYALEHGFKPIIETEQPEDGYWSPQWTETDDEIVLEWVETEPPMDEFGLPAEESFS